MRTAWLLITSLLLLWQVARSIKVPHVDECNFCQLCHAGESADTTDTASLDSTNSLTVQPSRHLLKPRRYHKRSIREVANNTHDAATSNEQKTTTVQQAANSHHQAASTIGHQVTIDSFIAAFHELDNKLQLPNCTECYGCNTELKPMHAASTIYNISYEHEKGATNNWLFRATTDVTPGQDAVVKVACVPISKRVGGKLPVCSPPTIVKAMRMHSALEQLAQDCGLTDIIPKSWVSKVNAVIPGIGFHIRWDALWMELIPGVSLESLLHKGQPHRLPPEQVLDLLTNRLNKTQVVRAAIFDLLTSQCDRHSQNIFIDEQGQLTLIDNEVSLQNSWLNCAFDSILIPTTQKQEIVRLSNQFILKYVTAAEAPKGRVDPQLLLDYRCYLGEGQEELGTNYPASVTQCLTKISQMTVEQVQDHYGLDELPAENLHTRASDMINKGFEWAFKYGEPRNAPPKRYLIQPKCCSMVWADHDYRCAHPYEPIYELPVGDPVTGREWTKPRRDTGTFEGGTRY